MPPADPKIDAWLQPDIGQHLRILFLFWSLKNNEQFHLRSAVSLSKISHVAEHLFSERLILGEESRNMCVKSQFIEI